MCRALSQEVLYSIVLRRGQVEVSNRAMIAYDNVRLHTASEMWNCIRCELLIRAYDCFYSNYYSTPCFLIRGESPNY